MSKLMMFAALAAVAGMTAGCFTSAGAHTKKTIHPDGTIVLESYVSVMGTGDKASQVAAEGLFADGDIDDLGAGVKTASAIQQSTGIKETLEGMGVLLTGIGQLVAKTQGVPVPSAVAGAESVIQNPEAGTEGGDTEYSSDGYAGAPGADGVGVYGQPGCSRCRAYKAAHPETQIIDVRKAVNSSALWAALKRLGYTGASVSLPVVVTATGYTAAAK
jgi:hypothetical protein